MYPVLFKIGNFELRSYGVALAISLLVVLWVSIKRAPRYGVEQKSVLDIALVIMISAVIGSRFWYVINHVNEFQGNWFDTINPFQNEYIGIAGLSMVGGIVLAILTSFVYAWAKKISFVNLGDTIAPGFLLGAGIQRLFGCFLNGCCFGRPTDSFLGIVFPPEGVAGSYFPGVPLWPTQLFAAALGFLGFALVLWLGRHQKFPGYTLYLVFAYYAVDRFIVDQFRYYESEQILGKIGFLTINVNHVLLAAVFAFCLALWLRGWYQQRRTQL